MALRGPAADHVLDLVFGVRLLGVHRAGRPDRQAEAEGAGLEDFGVDVLGALVGGCELGQVEGMHGVTIAAAMSLMTAGPRGEPAVPPSVRCFVR